MGRVDLGGVSDMVGSEIHLLFTFCLEIFKGTTCYCMKRRLRISLMITHTRDGAETHTDHFGRDTLKIDASR